MPRQSERWLSPIPGGDANGNSLFTLGTLIFGEDGSNNVLGVAKKPVVSGTYSGTSYQAVENDVDVLIKATPGNLFSLLVTNQNIARRYLQIFDRTTAPVSGASSVYSIPLAGGSTVVPGQLSLGENFFGAGGLYFTSGIAVGVSTSAGTFVPATVADHTLHGTYI